MERMPQLIEEQKVWNSSLFETGNGRWGVDHELSRARRIACAAKTGVTHMPRRSRVAIASRTESRCPVSFAWTSNPSVPVTERP